MAFRFKAQRPVADELKRIVAEELSAAVEQLSRSTPRLRDEAIHEARKGLKKVRAVLKLVRPAVGKSFYRDQNRAFRNAGLLLSELRDSGAVIETFDNLLANSDKPAEAKLAAPIRKTLLAAKQQTGRKLSTVKTMGNSARQIAVLARNSGHWPLQGADFNLIVPGLKNSYRDGKRAMRRALRSGKPDDFHEWRKRAKDHWYHLRLLENVWPDEMQGRERSVHEMESALGEDHNLSVLSDQLRQNAESYGGEEAVRAFLHLAAKEQAALREKAQQLGERVYAEKAGRFVQQLTHLWEASQATPKPARRVASHKSVA